MDDSKSYLAWMTTKEFIEQNIAEKIKLISH